MVFLLNTFGKASVPIIAPILFFSLGVDYASALRIGLATFSLPVLLGFGGISSRSNPCVLRSDATYLEAYFQTFFQILIGSLSCMVVVKEATDSGV